MRPYVPLRACIVVAAGISLMLFVWGIIRYPTVIASSGAPLLVSLFVAGIAGYVYAALRCSRIDSSEDALVLSSGLKWGVAIGLAWAIEVAGGNVIVPHRLGATIGIFSAFAAAMLPFLAGAMGASVTGRARTGAVIGLWSGVVSGSIAFIALACAGLLIAHFPGLPGVETPHNSSKVLTAEELAAFNLEDYLAGGISHLLLIGAPYCGALGAIGGMLARR